VLAFHRRLGLLLLVAATAVAVDRMFVGVHYPVDVAASLIVGLCSAVVVTTLGRQYVAWAVRQLSRLSDPVVAAARGHVYPPDRRHRS
jgi:membrane-associated phospholipid phosphatase